MNSLIPSGGPATTMTSLEIADLVEKRHDNVKRTIEMLAARGAIESPQSEEIPTATRPVQVYRVGKRDSYVIVAQLSPEFTARLVDRWQELEAQAAPARDPMDVLMDPVSMRTLLLGYTEKVLALEHKVEELAPKAEALDLISAGEDALTLTQAAKTLGIKREKLTSYLHAEGWVYRQNDSWVAYQQHIQNGRLLYKEARFTDQKTGQARTSPYCHILPKGLTLLARHFADRRAA